MRPGDEVLYVPQKKNKEVLIDDNDILTIEKIETDPRLGKVAECSWYDDSGNRNSDWFSLIDLELL